MNEYITISNFSFNMNERETVLIVDDEPDLVNLAQSILKLDDIQTLISTNGNQAMEILKNKHDTIGMILLDIVMPDKSGYEVLEEIRANDSFKDIRIYMFTVRNLQEDIERSRKLGADGFIPKPFPAKMLLKCVRRALGKEVLKN